MSNLRPLFPYLRKYRATFLIGALCVLCNNGVWIFFPLIIRKAIDVLNNGITKHNSPAMIRHDVLKYSLLLLAVAGVKAIFQYLTRWILIGVSREIEFDLRNDLFSHLEHLSYSFYQRTRTGDIMARATNDLNAVRMLVGPGIMYTANTLVFTAGALVFMLSISPRLTLFAFAPLPVFSIVVQYFGSRIHERFERIQAMFSDISARAQENFSGARLIRAYVQEEAEIQAFERENKEYIRRSLKLVRLMGMLWPTLELMLGCAVVLVLWLGGREVINGHSTFTRVTTLVPSFPGIATTLKLDGSMSVGQFVSFSTYMMQLTWPIIALGWVINIFQRGTASLIRINEILQEQPEIKDAPGAQAPEIKGEIEFRGLNFSYEGNEVLHDVKLRVPAGTSLAIVGPTGSGKTKLVRLIPRIYDAEPGMVLIDGRPIRDYLVSTLRKNIGFVPQETFLFSDRIRENIALGVDFATDQDIHNAADASNIAVDIEGFPEGYDTMVGERG